MEFFRASHGLMTSWFNYSFYLEAKIALIHILARNTNKINKSKPKVSHLFFANDILIFCGATKEECSTLITILEKYEQAPGHQLNREKTSLFFSRNTPQAIQDDVKIRFGVEIIK